MSVQQQLFKTLEDLGDNDFKIFKWNLSILEGYKPIPKSRLENAPRTDTVTRMIESYGEELAVKVTVQILREMGNKNAADELEKRYAAPPAAPVAPPAAPVVPPTAPVAPPAAPAAMSAQHGGLIIAPTVSGSTAGTWNITVNK